ncbi:MAG: hypothetical protein IPO92_08220 [Saprospiraceae bacterium]|nr:hypothetical protein [Saprospiraceae bacterium]
MAATGNITELKCVTVNLAHTWIGDLVVTLTHVSSGTSVQLFRRLNATGATSFGESSNLDGTYTFCATGASFATAGNGGGDAFVIPPDTYAQSSVSLQATPAQNTNTYANFVGLSLSGDWRLNIADYGASDLGTLRNWSFEACADAVVSSCPTAPAVLNNSGSVCSGGGTSTFAAWQTNRATAVAGAGGTGVINTIEYSISVPSSTNPSTGATNITGTIPAGCAAVTQAVTAYMRCDNGTPNNLTDDIWTAIGTYTLTVYPAVRTPNIFTGGCSVIVTGICSGDVVTLSGNTAAGVITNNGTNAATFTVNAGQPVGSINYSITSGVTNSTCVPLTGATSTPACAAGCTPPSCLITGSSSVCTGGSVQWCAPAGLSAYNWSTGATSQCIVVSTAGTYTVTVTDANGCTISCNKSLTVNTPPSCLIISIQLERLQCK